MNTTQYAEGLRACERGDPCPSNAHSDFESGYNAQYVLEQNEDNRSLAGE